MGIVLLFIYWFFVGVLYFAVGIPYILFKLSAYCLQRGFSDECSVGCRLITFILIEVAINFLLIVLKTVFEKCEEKCVDKGSPANEEDEANRLMENSKLSQTFSAWKLQYEIEEGEYVCAKNEMKLALKRQMKKRHSIVMRFKKTSKLLEKELDSKTKLLSNIKSKIMSLALDTESLVSQIRNSKTTLERVRHQNQISLERYAQLADQIKSDYKHFLNEQEQQQFINTYD